jgi:hypothetical protein
MSLLQVLVVMPGHMGTSIALNTRKVQSGNQSDAMDATQIAQARAQVVRLGHRGTPSLDAPTLPFLAARPIASLGPP